MKNSSNAVLFKFVTLKESYLENNKPKFVIELKGPHVQSRKLLS